MIPAALLVPPIVGRTVRNVKAPEYAPATVLGVCDSSLGDQLLVQGSAGPVPWMARNCELIDEPDALAAALAELDEAVREDNQRCEMHTIDRLESARDRVIEIAREMAGG